MASSTVESYAALWNHDVATPAMRMTGSPTRPPHKSAVPARCTPCRPAARTFTTALKIAPSSASTERLTAQAAARHGQEQGDIPLGPADRHLAPSHVPPSWDQRVVAHAQRGLMLAALSACVALLPLPGPALAAEEGAAGTFQRSCAACHNAGGNLLAPGKSLSRADLLREGLLDEEKLYAIIYSGKSRMPGFGEGCAPKGQCTFAARLSDEDIRQLASFIKEKADTDSW